MRLRERGRGKDAGHMLRRRQCCFYFCIFCAPAKAVSDFVPRIVSSSRLFGLAHRLHRACFDSSPQPLILSFLAFHSYPFLEHITSTIFSYHFVLGFTVITHGFLDHFLYWTLISQAKSSVRRRALLREVR